MMLMFVIAAKRRFTRRSTLVIPFIRIRSPWVISVVLHE